MRVSQFSPARRVEKFFASHHLDSKRKEERRSKGEKKNHLCCKQGEPPPLLALHPPLSHPRMGNSICQPPPLSYLIARKHKTRSVLAFFKINPAQGLNRDDIATNEFAPWKWIVLVPSLPPWVASILEDKDDEGWTRIFRGVGST